MDEYKLPLVDVWMWAICTYAFKIMSMTSPTPYSLIKIV